MGEKINSYKDLRVFQNAMNTAMTIFHITKHFPSEGKYSLVDQIRRSSYKHIVGQLVKMINDVDKWLIMVKR